MHLLAILVSLLTMMLAANNVEAKNCVAKSCTRKAEKANHSVYRVYFTKSGGFAGLHNEYSLVSNSLSKTEQVRLLELLDKSGIFNAKSVQEYTKGAADMFQYDFAVQQKGKKHTASYDDGTLPQAYRPLLDYVTKHGQTSSAAPDRHN